MAPSSELVARYVPLESNYIEVITKSWALKLLTGSLESMSQIVTTFSS